MEAKAKSSSFLPKNVFRPMVRSTHFYRRVWSLFIIHKTCKSAVRFGQAHEQVSLKIGECVDVDVKKNVTVEFLSMRGLL